MSNSTHTPPTQAELDGWKFKYLSLPDGLRLIAEVERLRADLINIRECHEKPCSWCGSLLHHADKCTDQRRFPRDAIGRAISKDCPKCGYGKLEYAGNGFWTCNGLMDPENPQKELEACDFVHEDGTANIKTVCPGDVER